MTRDVAGDDLEQRVVTEMQRLVPAGSRCVVAVSGGPDSLALLEILARTAARHQCELVVGHVDHGITIVSADVAHAVAERAAVLGLAFEQRNLVLGPDASETTARSARRKALRSMATAAGARAVILGHHADDQAETVLMRLLLGSGPAGLAGMAPRRGIWIRPLLSVPRAELAAYLSRAGVAAWADPANGDPRHLRSWLRVEVLPALRLRLPQVEQRLLRAGSAAARARAAWNDLPARVPELDLRAEVDGISVAAPVLQGYRSPLRHAILAALGRRCGVRLGVRRLAAIDRLLADPTGAAVIDLDGRVRAELTFGRLAFFLRGAPVESPVVLAPGDASTLGTASFAIEAVAAPPVTRAGWATTLIPGRYTARWWRDGDRISPLGGHGSRAVAVLLREARVPVRRRSRWPVVVADDDATIVWVPGICRSDAAVPGEGTEAWRVECAIT